MSTLLRAVLKKLDFKVAERLTVHWVKQRLNASESLKDRP